MHTVTPSTDISAQHVAIGWTGQGWTARDLGSRNGTWLDGRKLNAGEEAPLTLGSVLELGTSRARYTLVDAGAPQPRATCAGAEVEGADELLAIPGPDDPAALVILDPEVGWTLIVNDQHTPARDGEEVVVRGQTWRLSLPVELERTADARQARPASSALSLRFRVSADEEYVELIVNVNGHPHKLPSRAHHYLLLTLARARLDDDGAGPADRGWVYSEVLLDGLRISSNQLYVGLHRARKEIEALGIPDAEAFIERRTTSHQLRLGPRDVTVEVIRD